MNNALISPNELVYSYDGTLLGHRIAECSHNPFPIAPPLTWAECANEVNANEWYFQKESNSCKLIPIEPVATLSYEEKLNVIIVERNKRLTASDWTQMADVAASHDADWVSSWNGYRQELRDLPDSISEVNVDSVLWPTPPN